MGRQAMSALIASFRENYQNLLRFLALRRGRADRNADLAQGSCLRLATLRPANVDIEGPRAPVYRVAGSLANEMLRRDGRIAADFAFPEAGEEPVDAAHSTGDSAGASVPAATTRNK